MQKQQNRTYSEPHFFPVCFLGTGDDGFDFFFQFIAPEEKNFRRIRRNAVGVTGVNK